MLVNNSESVAALVGAWQVGNTRELTTHGSCKFLCLWHHRTVFQSERRCIHVSMQADQAVLVRCMAIVPECTGKH